MSTHDTLVFVDALEGGTARLLVGEDAFALPANLLPPGAREGTWLRLSLAIVPAPPSKAEGIRRTLSDDDPGGDIKL
jgi:hypothetical protein